MSYVFILVWTVCNHSGIAVSRAPGKSRSSFRTLLHLSCVCYSGSSCLPSSSNRVASDGFGAPSGFCLEPSEEWLEVSQKVVLLAVCALVMHGAHARWHDDMEEG